ncbi:MAG: DUF1648 domain-containing protein [Nitrososphaerales archaeon]
MNETLLFPPGLPLSRIGKVLLGLNVIGLFIIWFQGLYAYASLEGVVPTHFDLSGQPDSYGSSDVFLVVLPIVSIAPIIIILVTTYRFTLLNKYPYLINLPAFYAYIPKIPFEKRAYWVNRYFEAILAVGAFLSLYMNLMLWGIYLGTIEEALPNWWLPLIILMVSSMITSLIYYFYRLSKQMKKEIVE